MSLKIDFKIGLSLALTIVGFLVSIVVFSISYKTHQKYYPEAQNITENEQKVHFIAVGDIMLSRLVARKTGKSGNPHWMWENMGHFLKQSDFNIWNLESPTNGTPLYSYEETMIFNAPPNLVRTLSDMNFGIINLANNHALDQGESWLRTTEILLNEIGVASIGTGINLEQAWTPKIIEKNGIKIAFIGASYASINDNGSTQNPFVARMQDTERLRIALWEAKSNADYIIVNMHGWQEYSRTPTVLQKSFAKIAIENGADMVIGGHPHWTQGIELYRGKYIFYSLGNFVFDQDFSYETKNGLALQVFLSKKDGTVKLDEIQLHPVAIENYGQPLIMSWEAKKRALNDIGQINDILR
jgi:poly-gamma-glutamate capsule biosynthesis protein CapA/YwtB (metallophosphatase superfamily)